MEFRIKVSVCVCLCVCAFQAPGDSTPLLGDESVIFAVAPALLPVPHVRRFDHKLENVVGRTSCVLHQTVGEARDILVDGDDGVVGDHTSYPAQECLER